METSRFLRFSTYLRFPQRAICASILSGKHHKVLVIGGGSGGACVANRLALRLGDKQVAVVEPSKVHYYQALWTLVGAGIKPMAESSRETRDVLTRWVTLIPDRVVRFQPESSIVHLETGKRLTYDHLVLSLGFELRYDLIPGAIEALETDPRVVSNYSPKYVEKTFKAYQNFRGGRAIFTLPVGPIKCAGAPQKVMYLFDDHLRKTNRRNTAEIQYFTSLPKIFSVDKYAEVLDTICHERDIQVNLQHHLVEVRSTRSEVVMENISTKERRTLKYDFLHITPPMTIPKVLREVPKLTTPEFVDVDPKTLQHKHYPNIWSLGDCSSLPTSKTTSAVSSQAAVLSKNLRSVIDGGPPNVSVYDGYTACPLVTSYDRAIFAEFDYTMEPLETFPFDEGIERPSLYHLKTDLLPILYWDWLIKGFWSGPKYLRRILNFGLTR